MKRVTVTMHDVARLAGVSQTTVSLILNQSGSASFSQETFYTTGHTHYKVNPDHIQD